MSKGSKRRPSSVNAEEADLRWELITPGTTEERKLEILKELKKLRENK